MRLGRQLLGTVDAWSQLSGFGMMNVPSRSCGGSCPSGALYCQKVQTHLLCMRGLGGCWVCLTLAERPLRAAERPRKLRCSALRLGGVGEARVTGCIARSWRQWRLRLGTASGEVRSISLPSSTKVGLTDPSAHDKYNMFVVESTCVMPVRKHPQYE